MKSFVSIILLLGSGALISHAQIVHFSVNETIPDTFDGLFVDIDGGTTGASTTAVPNWDVNFFLGGAGIYTNTNFQTVSSTTGGDLAAAINLPSGTLVQSSLDYSTASTITGSSAHMGTGLDQFAANNSGFLGFSFDPGDGVKYGWARVTFLNSGPSGTLHEWAYDSTGASLEAGTVPEPSTYALLLGVMALAFVVVLTGRNRETNETSDEEPKTRS